MSNLPKDWEFDKLGNIATFFKGKGISKKDISNEGYDCIRYGELFTIYNEVITKIYSKTNSIEDMIFSENNDTLMPTSDVTPRGLATASALSKSGVILGGDILIIRSNKLLNSYLSYYIRSHKSEIMKLVKGSTVYHIYANDMKNFQIFIPPLEEQKKIADILSTVDKKIAFVEENINATEELKKGLMQKLLTEGIGHTEFKDSELGRIPESWEIIPLDKVIALLTDYHANGSYEKLKENVELLEKENYAVMVRTTNFEKNDFTENLIYITEHAYNYLKKSKVYENDIVINKIANAGATYIMPKLDKPVSLAMNLFLLKLIDTVDNRFIYLQIKIREASLKALSSGTSTKTITKNDVKGFKIALAPYEEQKQIAEILSTVDNKLENLKEKKLFFQELKKGLMQKLLTGEVRV